MIIVMTTTQSNMKFIEISIDISQLIQAMEQTIAEASLFVSVLVDQKAITQKALPSR